MKMFRIFMATLFLTGMTVHIRAATNETEKLPGDKAKTEAPEKPVQKAKPRAPFKPSEEVPVDQILDFPSDI